MSIGSTAIAAASIGGQLVKAGGKKSPSKRTVQAIADRRLTPEQR